MNKSIFVLFFISSTLVSEVKVSNTVEANMSKEENKSLVQELLDSKSAQEAINAPGVIVIDFFADWCSPCKDMKPIFEELAQECKDYSFKSINCDKVSDIAAKYKVSGMPAFFVFKDGKVLDKFLGKQSKEDLLKKIKDVVTAPTDLKKLSQEQLDAKFFNAVKNMQPIESLQELLDAGANINAKDERNITALMLIMASHLPQGVDCNETIKFFLKNGAETSFDIGNGKKMEFADHLNMSIDHMKKTIVKMEQTIETLESFKSKKKKMVCNGDVCTLQ